MALRGVRISWPVLAMKADLGLVGHLGLHARRDQFLFTLLEDGDVLGVAFKSDEVPVLRRRRLADGPKATSRLRKG